MLMAIGIDLTAPAVIASVLAAVLATVGLLSVWRNEIWAERNSAYFSSFASGILFTTAILLIPEGMLATRYAPYLALFGYFVLYFLNVMVGKPGSASFGAALVPFLAVSFHSYIDGLEYGILFRHDQFVGITASIGLIAHEFAEGAILFLLLRKAGASTGAALIFSFIGAAVTTPIGAISSQVFLAQVDSEFMGMLLSVAAGALLYVGATHLTEHTKDGDRRGTITAYILGLVIAVGMNIAHMASGEHDHRYPTEVNRPAGMGH